MSRLQNRTSGRPLPPLERLDAKILREKINSALDSYGLPHSTRQAVGSMGRRRLFIEQEDLHEDSPDDVLP